MVNVVLAINTTGVPVSCPDALFNEIPAGKVGVTEYDVTKPPVTTGVIGSTVVSFTNVRRSDRADTSKLGGTSIMVTDTLRVSSPTLFVPLMV
jgi:hypothetical protein